jgi:hypothetical protein
MAIASLIQSLIEGVNLSVTSNKFGKPTCYGSL